MKSIDHDAAHRQGIIVKVILTLMALVIGLYLYNSIEVYEETVSSGFEAEALQQEFLAAQAFLQLHDKNVELEDDYRALYADSSKGVYPQYDHTVILSEGEIALSSALKDQILAWVEQGGHLILALNASSEEDGFRANALINHLNVGIDWLPTDEFGGSTTEQYPTEIVNSDDQVLMVNLENSYRLALPESESITYSVGDEDGITFAQMEMGQGLITLLTEVYIWNNYQIDEEDNVELLALLVGNSPKVYIFSAKELPHWFSLLMDFAPYFIWVGSGLILVMMWRAAVRFGPVLYEGESYFSPFSVHIKASGEYYWRAGKQKELIEDVRRGIFAALYHKRPVCRGADKSIVVKHLCQISEWPEDIIDELMFSQKSLNENQFSQRIASLQTLRKML
ncbi:DUF4350 domain-containing protein [Aliiglaciecola sp. M165]|uniref:DUF4350 domain-containing protein n=1 Tax=Aliiglaciecola sp. M165 TaxID=2593649 RepID=UPI00117F9F6C|nr:DUF4350 domain-containing protein [Aliiglaciecola sp. M165]TRY30708.1 DUF4350 domain-containing protein [Aliiglaciecola sp. M165]